MIYWKSELTYKQLHKWTSFALIKLSLPYSVCLVLQAVACNYICMRGVFHKYARGMWNIEEAFKTFYLNVVKYGPSETVPIME